MTSQGKTNSGVNRITVIACLLLAGFFGVRAVIGSRHDSAPPTKVLQTKDIEQVKVFDRLLGHNPIAEDTHRDLAEPDPATWRVLDLSMQKSNGKPLDITLARPIAWIEATGAHEGGTIELDLPEMGAVGAADVIAIRSCPPLRAGPGNVVTGTFAHEPDDNLLNIHLEGASDPIGCTPNHRFWSETAQAFVEAGDLHPGDTVRTRQHGPIRIASIAPRPFEHRVYNLEVHGEHVYEVASSGVLVHNNYTRVNVGGEGEIPGAINVNGKWVTPDMPLSRDGTRTIGDMIDQGEDFITAEMDNLPFGTGSVDEVITNNVRIGGSSHLGPYPQESEIWRILKPDGNWIHNGVVMPRP